MATCCSSLMFKPRKKITPRRSERVANVLGFAAAEQRVEIGPDLAADSRGEVDDFELCGGESHGHQLTLVRMVLAECFTRGCFHSSTASETVISE